MKTGLIIGIDTGGTFTDVVVYDPTSRRFHFHKVHSTPDDPGRALVHGILEAIRPIQSGVPGTLVHGTTVATNAVLQRSGARIAFVTTHGFRDVLHIQRQSRPKLYDLRTRRTDPLVPRSRRFEVVERTLFDGQVKRPIDSSSLAPLIQTLQDEGVQAVAIGFLNSYVNPQNELTIASALRSQLPGVPVCASHDLSQEQGEYERFSTCVMNAYVQPVMQRYLGQLDAALTCAAIEAPLWVMKSNGGVTTAERAATECVQTILSGPAGGVVCGAQIAQVHTNPNLVTADMGGTSFDVAVLDEGRIGFARDAQIDGLAIQVPMLDIHTVGAGGGSIGWLDAGGALRVGPHSAGAVPGPACYGRGGSAPTVTDANLVLGRVAVESRLGNGMRLDIETARASIYDTLAKPLGLTIERAAEGMIRIVNTTMVAAIRKVTVERGLDPRKFTLCPFGGAGPLHGSELAEEMSAAETLIPLGPGVTSALGLLMSNLREDRVRTYIVPSHAADLTDIDQQFSDMEQSAASQLRTNNSDSLIITRRIGMRYRGQGFDIPITIANSEIDLPTIVRDFHAQHKRLYGYDSPQQTVEIAHLWVSVEASMGAMDLPRPHHSKVTPSPLAERRVMFDGNWIETPIFERHDLAPGLQLDGPAIAEQIDCTTVIWPKQHCTVDPFGQLILSRRG